MPPVKKHKAGSNPNPSKLGRKGDSRMEIALNARLADTKMPLQKALELGGFVFIKGRDGIVYDKDNVRLSQRKNQLSRRIRKLKSQTNPPNIPFYILKNSYTLFFKRIYPTDEVGTSLLGTMSSVYSEDEHIRPEDEHNRHARQNMEEDSSYFDALLNSPIQHLMGDDDDLDQPEESHFDPL